MHKKRKEKVSFMHKKIKEKISFYAQEKKRKISFYAQEKKRKISFYAQEKKEKYSFFSPRTFTAMAAAGNNIYLVNIYIKISEESVKMLMLLVCTVKKESYKLIFLKHFVGP